MLIKILFVSVLSYVILVIRGSWFGMLHLYFTMFNSLGFSHVTSLVSNKRAIKGMYKIALVVALIILFLFMISLISYKYLATTTLETAHHTLKTADMQNVSFHVYEKDPLSLDAECGFR
ncbi:hypothetical protein Hanom_Chr12g01129291 [Helianthus anomalus]